jgi:pilus assembly protein Flp/PilA
MSQMINSVRKFFGREEGATMVEYGLMVALIAVVCIIVVGLLGVGIQGMFQDVVDVL